MGSDSCPSLGVAAAPLPIGWRAELANLACGRQPCLKQASIAAGRDLAYIVVHGDAALDVIGGISSK
jgi:hypothetical protein